MEKAVMYVAENKYGLRSELIKTIGMESYNHLCLSGIISETFANGKPCWRCTAEVKKIKDFYDEYRPAV